MSLTHAEVLSIEKWSKEGNLLGRTLELVREELPQEPIHSNLHRNHDCRKCKLCYVYSIMAIFEQPLVLRV